MKAKEYYERLKNAEDRKDIFVENVRDFCTEFSDLVKARNITTMEGMKKAFAEHNRKWMKYAQMVNEKLYPSTKPVRLDGFRRMLQQIDPVIYANIK